MTGEAGATTISIADRIRSHLPRGRRARIVRVVLWMLATYLIAKLLWGPPNGLVLYAVALGALYGLIGAGVVLVFRTHRILNFAAGTLGSAPAVLALTLYSSHRVPYFVAVPLAMVGGIALGWLVDVVIMRRFAKSPRLVVTSLTIGLLQLFAYLGASEPRWLGLEPQAAGVRLHTPLSDHHVQVGQTPLTGDYALAIIVVVLFGGLLGAFFKWSRLGLALRAAADNGERALLLGLPVKTVGAMAWAIAGLFSATAIFLRAPLVGLPGGGPSETTVTLFALTAQVMARMDSIPVALAAGLTIGILDQSSVFATGGPYVTTGLLLLAVLGALTIQKQPARTDPVTTWQSIRHVRPIPAALRALPEVRLGRVLLGFAALLLLVTAPLLVPPSRQGLVTVVVIYAMICVSLVILTGWAGQISLGQFGFAGVGAAVAGGLAANHNVDFFFALAAAVISGAVIAIVVGLPALRIQGFFLTITTFAFAAAMEFYILNDRYPIGRVLLPKRGRVILRPRLWGVISLGGPGNELPFYYLCLGFLGLVVAMALAFRRNRSGRILIAMRENPRSATTFAVNLARNRLAAFAVAGAICSLAGALLAYHQGSVDPSTYGVPYSAEIFVVSVIGGITSLLGAILGAVVIEGAHYFGAQSGIRDLPFLVTGPGLVVMLYFLPGGFASVLYAARDRLVSAVGRMHGIAEDPAADDVSAELAEAAKSVVGGGGP